MGRATRAVATSRSRVRAWSAPVPLRAGTGPWSRRAAPTRHGVRRREPGRRAGRRASRGSSASRSPRATGSRSPTPCGPAARRPAGRTTDSRRAATTPCRPFGPPGSDPARGRRTTAAPHVPGRA